MHDNRMKTAALNRSGTLHPLLLSAPWIAATVFLAFVVRNYWVGDDAYISFRSLDQLFAGHGPRWNPVDRVQVYTSPLWFWVMALSRLAIHDVYLNALVLSVGMATVLAIYLIRNIRNPVLTASLFLSLLLSNSFMDFTGSGLEYPLVYLLTGLFAFSFSQYSKGGKSPQTARQFMVVASLLMVTRHDLLLMILPPCIACLWWEKQQRFRLIALLSAPLVCWTLYSLIYYGLAFPNTAYAKLHLDVPTWQFLEQGVMYFYRGLTTDIFSLLVLLAGIPFLLLQRASPHLRILALSALLPCAYTLWVGGDFMAGRFYSYPFFLVCLCLCQYLDEYLDSPDKKLLLRAAVIGPLALGYAVFYPHTPVNTPAVFDKRTVEHGISDERGMFSGFTSIWKYFDNDKPYFPDHSTVLEGLAIKNLPGGPDNLNPPVIMAIGIFSYWAGLDAYVLDVVALPDAMRSRLPRQSDGWAVGHTARFIPGWYYESMNAKKPLMTYDSALNTYFSAVSRLTQDDDLFSPERLETILMFNLGFYEHYLHESSRLLWHPSSQAYNYSCTHSWGQPHIEASGEGAR